MLYLRINYTTCSFYFQEKTLGYCAKLQPELTVLTLLELFATPFFLNI